MHDVIEAKYVDNYTIWLRFDDGSAGEIDLSGELDGEVFEPLKDVSLPLSFYTRSCTSQSKHSE